jgi:hypothetical protein
MKAVEQNSRIAGAKKMKSVPRYRHEESEKDPNKGDYFIFKAFAVLLLVIIGISFVTKMGGKATDQLEEGFMSTFNPGMNRPSRVEQTEPYLGNPNYP